MHRFWHEIPSRVDLKKAQILKIDGQVSKWHYGELDIKEIHDETLSTLYFKYFYNTKYHGEVDILDAITKVIENLSDDEIAELCAICTSPSHIDISIWKDIGQAGLERGPAYL